MSMDNGCMFGEWCIIDQNVFCQEHMGCKFCYKMQSQKNVASTVLPDMAARKALQPA